MKILQKPISAEHKSAMFFDGVIATKTGLELKTFQDGEITLSGNVLVGQDIINMAHVGVLDDEVLEAYPVDILVDKFIAIYETGSENPMDEDYIFDNYDDALEALMQL